MAHPQQFEYIESVRSKFPKNFFNAKVLEVGSVNINGSIRMLFSNCDFLGIDLAPGPDVDLVCEGQKLDHPDGTYDTIVTAECFEHNPFWVETFENMYRMIKPNGLIIMTCATTGRPEHGTTRTNQGNACFTSTVMGWEYYKNLTEEDFREKFDIDAMFSNYEFKIGTETCDLYFHGVKKI